MESSCCLLLDEAGKPHSLFTGDTLSSAMWVGPDLAQKAADMTQEDLAGLLYDSLNAKGEDPARRRDRVPRARCRKRLRQEHEQGDLRRWATRSAPTMHCSPRPATSSSREVTDGLLPPRPTSRRTWP